MKDFAVIDFETEPIEVGSYPPKPVGVAISAPDRPKDEYLAWGHPEGNNCTLEKATARLREVFKRFAIICHNAAFDLFVAVTHLKLPMPAEYHCTMILAFLDDPQCRDLRLKEYYEGRYGVKPTERDKLYAWIKEHIPAAKRREELGEFIYLAPGNVVSFYAIGDVRRPRRLYHDLQKQIHRGKMDDAYRRELRMLPVTFNMTRLGVPVDRRRLARDLDIWTGVLRHVELRIAKRLKVDADSLKTAGKESWSPDKLADALEASGAVDVTKWSRKVNGKGSTAYDELKVAIKDKGLLAMLDLRGMLGTDLNTFMRPWLEYSERDGRLHFNWNTTRRPGRDERRLQGARTGRMSSTPNLQNVPKEPPEAPKEILRYLSEIIKRYGYLPNMRDYLIAPPDGYMIQRDYDQQEFRILGHYENGALLKAYLEDPTLDIHTYGQIGVNKLLHTNYERKPIKNLGFGIIYGQGIGLTASVMGTTVENARKIRQIYLTELVPGIEPLQRSLRLRAARKEPFYTWGGRRYFCEPPRLIKGQYKTFEYKMLNGLIQGSAADCTKEAAIRACEVLEPDCLAIMIHDEFVCLAGSETEARRRMALLKEAIESIGLNGRAPTFEVPMTSKGKWSRRSWGTLKEFHDEVEHRKAG